MSGEKHFVGVEETMEEDMKKCHPSPKMDRKTVEKRRRIQMKTLYSKLNSLIPHHHHSRDVPMLSDQLDEAINHIKTLQEDLEKMKERKKSLMEMDEINKIMNMGTAIGLQPTRIEIQDLGSTMMVQLISGLDNQLIFYKSICVIEEEGAEVVNASYYIMDDKVFHTIHCKISDCELGYKGAKISGDYTSLYMRFPVIFELECHYYGSSIKDFPKLPTVVLFSYIVLNILVQSYFVFELEQLELAG